MSTVTVAGPTGTSMRGLLTAQLLKLRTRGGLILLALNLLLPLAGLVVTLAMGQQTFDLTGADLARPLTDAIDNPLLALILVAVVAGADYRHGTVVPTLLAEPRRLRVALSTLLAAGGIGVAIAAVCAALGAAIALPWLATQGVPIGDVLTDPDLWWRILGQTTVMAVLSLIGASLAILLRGALGSILTVLGISFGEGFLAGLLGPQSVSWGLFSSLDRLGDPTAVDLGGPLWQPVLVVVGVLTAVVAAALVSTARRDAA